MEHLGQYLTTVLAVLTTFTPIKISTKSPPCTNCQELDKTTQPYAKNFCTSVLGDPVKPSKGRQEDR